MLTGRCAARTCPAFSEAIKRNGQLPGAAEKIAMLPKPQRVLPRTAPTLTAAAKARGLLLFSQATCLSGNYFMTLQSPASNATPSQRPMWKKNWPQVRSSRSPFSDAFSSSTALSYLGQLPGVGHPAVQIAKIKPRH